MKKTNKLNITAPILTITFCYVMITRIFVTVTSQFNHQGATATMRHMKDNQRHKKLVRTTVKAVMAFVAGWTPYAVIAVVASLGYVSLNIYFVIS